MRNRRRAAPGWRDDRGNQSVEMVVLVFPITVILLGLLFAVWQMSVARHDVTTAAAAAARAASLKSNPSTAATAAHDAAHATLADAGRSCTHLSVQVDTSRFSHGGHVTVTVTCQADVSDVVLLDVPATVDVRAQARAPIETYRQLEPSP